jgi:hypothetical protein
LTLAKPEGYVRIFVDEGLPMARLLSEAAAHGVMPDYVGKLLAVFEAEKQKSEDKSYLPPVSPALPEGHRDGESLIEPLSQRELKIPRDYRIVRSASGSSWPWIRSRGITARFLTNCKFKAAPKPSPAPAN